MRLAAGVLLLAGLAFGQWPTIRLHPIASGLTSPTAIAELPDGSGALWVLEQPGRVRAIRNGALVAQPVLTVPQISSGGERGLLGIAFPPRYSDKGYFYLSYTDPQGSSVVSRWRVAGQDRANPDSEQIIVRIARSAANHNGGGIAFGPDGYLYIGTGDSGSAGDPANAAQNPTELRGKMLRFDTESGQEPSIPASNPFRDRTGYQPSIWAFGLRNPWRFSFDRQTGDLWIADVGQGRAEEINFQPASSRGGENYGWRMMEGLQCYPPATNSCSRDGLTLPVLEYPRSLGISVTGGFVYRGARFPALRGIYLYSDYGSGRIWGLRRSGGSWENQELLASGMNISTFGEDLSGELYLANHSRGIIYSVVADAPSVSATAVVNAASFGAGLVPGSLATAFGAGISTLNGVVQAEQFPLPTELAGVSVTLNGTAVPLTAVVRANGQEQINFQIPFELAGSNRATLVVTANGATSAPVEIPIAAVQPEIFAITRSGDTATVWATGLGGVSNPPPSGAAALGDPLSRTSGTTTVTVGGTEAPVLFSGLAPGYAGLYQVNVSVGADRMGDVVLRVGAASSLARPLPPGSR